MLRLLAQSLRLTLKIGYMGSSKGSSKSDQLSSSTILASPQLGFNVGGNAGLCQIYFYSEKKILLNTITGEKFESKLVHKEPNKLHFGAVILLRRTGIH